MKKDARNPETGWRDIATAPMNTNVLVLDEDRSPHCATQVSLHKWRDVNEYVVWRPTHWMPIPPAPVSAPEGEGKR